jgi:hypothetical protein
MSYVSKGNFVERLGAWSLGKSRGKNVHAALFQGDHIHRIWLHTHYYEEDSKHAPFSKIDLLKNLAHEIGHIEEPTQTHTPRHEKICSKITMAFMRRLHADGYESEEEELGK